MTLPNAASFGPWTAVVAAVVLGMLLLKLFSSKHRNLPPGPRALPIIGNLHLLGKHPHEDLAKLAKTYGPVMSLWFGQKLTVVATSPAAAEEFLRTQGPNFSSRPKTSFSEIVVPEDIVTMPDSTKRQHLKKILRLQLSTTKQLRETERHRAEEITHVLDMMPQDGRTVVPVRTYLEVVVTNILSRMVLKKRLSAVAGKGNEIVELEQVRRFKVLTQDIAESFVRIDPGDLISVFRWVDILGIRRGFRNLRKRMDAFMSNIVSERLEQRKSGTVSEKDMLDVLLDQMEDETSRFDITNTTVRSVMWNAFVAGTTTTTDGIEWAMAECIHNPEVMSKVQAELDAVVGKSRRVEPADIPNLKYLQAVIKETFRLRLSPPLLVPHENESTDCKVLGYDIPKGTSVFVNAGAIARDPSIWEDPLEFKPERFLDGSPHATTDVQGNHFELLTFGCGRRACPGMALAIEVVQMITATMLHSFDWSLPNDLQPTDLDMSEAEGLLPCRAQPLSAIPKPRLSISSAN